MPVSGAAFLHLVYIYDVDTSWQDAILKVKSVLIYTVCDISLFGRQFLLICVQLPCQSVTSPLFIHMKYLFLLPQRIFTNMVKKKQTGGGCCYPSMVPLPSIQSMLLLKLHRHDPTLATHQTASIAICVCCHCLHDRAAWLQHRCVISYMGLSLPLWAMKKGLAQ